jgi:hypothetical protein
MIQQNQNIDTNMIQQNIINQNINLIQQNPENIIIQQNEIKNETIEQSLINVQQNQISEPKNEMVNI